MIISHSKKFIFFHIFKVAGNNIRAELREYNYTKSKKHEILSFLKIYPSVFSTDFTSHITALEAKGKLSSYLFQSYYKFAFVRNPWDWQVSLYHFMLQNVNHFQHDFIKKLSFDEYIDWRVSKDLNFQKDFLVDESGYILVDFIGKMENLQMDFDKICEHLKIPTRVLPIRNSSKHMGFKEYYSDNTAQIIREAFHEDITLFDYTFET